MILSWRDNITLNSELCTLNSLVVLVHDNA